MPSLDNLKDQSTNLVLPSSYLEARKLFLAAATAKNGNITNHENKNYQGISGEKLFCDIAVFGSKKASSTLIISSGTHGIEGYCGNAMQCALLNSNISKFADDNLQIIFVHAVNPYGFSHFRRTNENNIDLNRHFVKSYSPRKLSKGYETFRKQVFPKKWQNSDLEAILHAVNDYIDKFGLADFQNNLTIGQYTWPEDPFYGGAEESWSHQLWNEICRSVSENSDIISHIDLHSGLGEYGATALIFGATLKDENFSLAKKWYGEDKIFAPGDGASVSSLVSGTLGSCLDKFNVINVGIALEFGTVPIQEFTQAIISDNWLVHNPQCSEYQRIHIQQQVKSTFFINETDWLDLIWAASKLHVTQSLIGLTEGNNRYD